MTISTEIDNVHRAIIHIHRELFGESPTPMKLQKLCYYAQGYALAESKELFPDDFQAWQHGPVVFDLYSKYKDFQWRQLTDDVGDFDKSNYEYLQSVVSAYGRYDGAALSTMTHREAPWLTTREGLDESAGCNKVISKKVIAQYFSAKLNANGG